MTKKITDLQPQKANANRHTEHGVRLLRKSVQDYGLADGITVAANDEAISGSMRIETLADMMPDVKIQIVETYGDTLLVNKRMDIPTPDTKQGRALSVASNVVAHTDYDMDGDLLKEWAGEDEAIRKMFADSEWQEVTGEEKPTKDAEPQIDRAAELLDKWQVKTGDLWQIGEHRLLCGDSTKREDVERVMGGERADVGFFDPPYGISFQSNGRTATEKFDRLHGDDKINGDWLQFMVYYLEDAGAAYICTRWDVYSQWEQIIKEHIQIKNVIVWDKVDWSSGDLEGDYSPRHEFIFYCVKGRHKLRGHRESNVWAFGAQNKQNYLHPTQKKVEVPSMAIDKSSESGSVVMDWFVGSGTTLVACQNLGRKGRGIEISPNYVAVCLERMATAFPELEIVRLHEKE